VAKRRKFNNWLLKKGTNWNVVDFGEDTSTLGGKGRSSLMAPGRVHLTEEIEERPLGGHVARLRVPSRGEPYENLTAREQSTEAQRELGGVLDSGGDGRRGQACKKGPL